MKILQKMSNLAKKEPTTTVFRYFCILSMSNTNNFADFDHVCVFEKIFRSIWSKIEKFSLFLFFGKNSQILQKR